MKLGWLRCLSVKFATKINNNLKENKEGAIQRYLCIIMYAQFVNSRGHILSREGPYFFLYFTARLFIPFSFVDSIRFSFDSLLLVFLLSTRLQHTVIIPPLFFFFFDANDGLKWRSKAYCGCYRSQIGHSVIMNGRKMTKHLAIAIVSVTLM